MSSMIGSLFEQVWKWISAETEKLVDYVLNFVKTTGDSISKGVSRLQNLWTLLKASISVAIARIKESCLEGVRILMKPILQLTKWLADQVVELIGGLPDGAKCVSMMESSLDKTVVVLDSLRPGVSNVKVKPGAGGVKKGGVDGSVIAPCVIELIRLLGKYGKNITLGGVKVDAMIVLARDVVEGVSSFVKIVGVFV